VSEPAHLQTLLARGQQTHAADVRTDCEDERLARTPIAATFGVRASISVTAASSAASPAGPNVFGRVWSKPLSRVITANSPATPGTST
jgi:hypothetical protein